MAMKPGDKVRVSIDTNGGSHPYVGQRGYYTDIVREVQDGAVILTRVSWVRPYQCMPTHSLDALVTLDGREHRIRMLERGKLWWAKIPWALEPLATGATYEEALAAAVRRLATP